MNFRELNVLIIKNCPQCKNKAFISQECDNRTYCSCECKADSQRKLKIKRVCEYCGISFPVHPCAMKYNANRFCSPWCYRVWNKGKHHPLHNTKRPEAVKKSIGEKLKGRIPWNRGVKEYFHHTEKTKQQMSIARTLDKHPQWRGGSSFLPYSSAFNKTLKEIIRIRDNQECQLCGLSEKLNRRKLDIHHKDYNKEFCSADNLIALCHSCHSKTHYNRQWWIDYFLEI